MPAVSIASGHAVLGCFDRRPAMTAQRPPQSIMPEPEFAPPPGREPRGYFLALSSVSDAARFQQYRSVVSKLREVYEGRELVRAQRLIAVLGPASEEVLTIVEHPTVSQLRMLLSAPEYVELRDKLKSLAPGPTWIARGVWPLPEPALASAERRAYAVARFHLDNPVRHAQFRDLIGRLIVAYGGRILVRLDRSEPVSGPSDGRLLTLVEFPSLKALLAAVDSQDYKDMLALDLGHGERSLWVVEGV
jgi:uncharacterized protein (DUF1330 family)